VRPYSAVGIATGYRLDDQGIEFKSQCGQEFSLPIVQNDSRAHPASYLVGIGGLFPQRYSSRGMKLTTHLPLALRSRKHKSIYPFPHMSSWRSAQLVKHKDNFTFYRHITGYTQNHVIDGSFCGFSRVILTT
jgi:hypothetical protein